jgi:hypothetical protein
MVQIRRALTDDSQEMIRTISRRGYVFSAPLTIPVSEFPKAVERPPSEGDSPVRGPALKYRSSWGKPAIVVLALVVVALTLAELLFSVLHPRKKREPVYSQITNFTDSAAGPVLSPLWVSPEPKTSGE